MYLLKLTHGVLCLVDRVGGSVCLLGPMMGVGVLSLAWLTTLSLEDSVHPLYEVGCLRNGWPLLPRLMRYSVQFLLLLALCACSWLLLGVRVWVRCWYLLLLDCFSFCDTVVPRIITK